MRNGEIIKRQMDNVLIKLPILRDGLDFVDYRNLINLLLSMYLDFSNKFGWDIEITSTLDDTANNYKLAAKYVEKIKTVVGDEIAKSQELADFLILENRYAEYRNVILVISVLMEIEKYTKNDYVKLQKEYNTYKKTT